MSNDDLYQKAENAIKRLREKGKEVVPVHENIEKCFTKIDEDSFFWFNVKSETGYTTGAIMILD